MKTAFYVWLTAIFYECIIYCIYFQSIAGFVVFPFGIVGGFPGLLMFAMLLQFVPSFSNSARVKYAFTLFITMASAALTTVFFFFLMDEGRGLSEGGYWPFVLIAVVAAVLSLFTFRKSVYKNYIATI